jgi:hypothetical protein
MWMKHALCRCVIVAISDDKLRPDQKRRTQAGKINVNNRTIEIETVFATLNSLSEGMIINKST